MTIDTERPLAPGRTWLWLLLLALAVYGWGIQKNLPYVAEVDEYSFWVSRAVGMAVRGDLNPGWFGHPGSTVLYPLAAIYRLGYGSAVAADFAANPTPFFLLGRLLSIGYAALSIPVLYLLGRRIFNRSIALLGSLLYLASTLVVAHAQVVRSDSAAVLFSLLALWTMARLYDQPRLGLQAQAGLWMGLSISSRYVMAVLVLAFVALNVALALRAADPSTIIAQALSGVAAMLVTFYLTTPYMWLDPQAVLESISFESRTSHLGADGLSPAGNLWWYLREALPVSITWPQYLASALGLATMLWRRRFLPLWLLGYVGAYLLAISLPALHWHRWLIPILPLIALAASAGCWQSLRWLKDRLPRSPRLAVAFALAGAALLAYPATAVITHNIRESRPSTRVLAREWLLASVPPESRIVEEWYAAPLAGTAFEFKEVYALAWDPTLVDAAAGYNYALVSSSMYDRFNAEPAKYPAEIGFYAALADNPLVFEVAPDRLRGGPVIRVYRLR
jgi:4-amino-4-deoxy-L-arabinose transferase-like glycosyltransferase